VGDEAEGIASMLLQLGIKTTVDAIASSVDLAAKLMRGDFFLTFTGGGNSLDDPADQVTNRVITGGGLNYGKFSSARVDKLLADQDAELDPAKRRALIYDLQRELLDQAAYVPINTFPILYAAQPYVEGLTIDRAFSIGAHHRLENVWLNR
jgi:ABC-type transport system substrate-binding protein